MKSQTCHCPVHLQLLNTAYRKQINVVGTEAIRERRQCRGLGLKTAQDIIRTVMMNMLWGLFKLIMTVSVSVTVFQMIGKSNGLLNKLNRILF